MRARENKELWDEMLDLLNQKNLTEAQEKRFKYIAHKFATPSESKKNFRTTLEWKNFKREQENKAGEIIREYLNSRTDVSLEKIADITGVTVQTVRLWVNGKNLPRYRKMTRRLNNKLKLKINSLEELPNLFLER